MNIQNQISLFFRRYGEGSDNSRVTPEQALEYINSSRADLSQELKFYNVTDKLTAKGGETYWTMRDDFLGPRPNVRDWATYDEWPFTIKALANWAELVNKNIIGVIINANMLAVMDDKVFRINFKASSGAKLVWLGYGRPKPLGALTGVDAYLTSEQATMTVLDAVIDAKDDAGDRVGQKLYDKWLTLKKAVKRAAEATGPRLEAPPDG